MQHLTERRVGAPVSRPGAHQIPLMNTSLQQGACDNHSNRFQQFPPPYRP